MIVHHNEIKDVTMLKMKQDSCTVARVGVCDLVEFSISIDTVVGEFRYTARCYGVADSDEEEITGLGAMPMVAPRTWMTGGG